MQAWAFSGPINCACSRVTKTSPIGDDQTYASGSNRLRKKERTDLMNVPSDVRSACAYAASSRRTPMALFPCQTTPPFTGLTHFTIDLDIPKNTRTVNWYKGLMRAWLAANPEQQRQNAQPRSPESTPTQFAAVFSYLSPS